MHENRRYTKRVRRLTFNLFLRAAVLLAVFVSAEVCIYLAALVTKVPSLQISYLQNKLKNATNTHGEVLGSSSDQTDEVNLSFGENHMLHPYTGFSGDVANRGFNSYGFVGADPIEKRSPDKLIVGIFGGSVANELYHDSKETLIAELSKNPVFGGRNISVNLYGLGGFKQPQQLITLTYLLSIGAEFDIIINLDGFNEIALPYSENIPMGVNPAYPRSWKFYAHKGNNIGASKETGYISVYKDMQSKWNDLFNHFPANKSVLFLNLWEIGFRVSQNQINDHTLLLEKALSYGDDEQSVGPPLVFNSDEEIFRYSAKIWANSSIDMNNLAKGHGIHYYHFLQPNQYVEGSKIFTPTEKKYAISAVDTAYKKSVRQGYKYLIEKGSFLRAKGVSYYDLTTIFKDNPTTLYYDKCCHFNKNGQDIVARYVASVVNESASSRNYFTDNN